MKAILSILFALIAFTVIPTNQARADIYSAGGMAAIASEATVGHGSYRSHRHDRYYGRPHYRGNYRSKHYYRNYNRPRRSGVTIRF
ncbi:MAG: hypothetical protein ACAI35_08590 [Candidatus Methylacidiphilales bacterium]|nr:hypothetical protein [Candidatus Methylacidiphilales bacterium]